MAPRPPILRLLALVLILGGLAGLAIGWFFFSSEGDADSALSHPMAWVGIPYLAGSGAVLLLTFSWLAGDRDSYISIAAVIALVLFLDLFVYLSVQ